MKIILKIARAELRSLFYAPIAWVVIVAFFLITSMDFISALKEFAKMQEIQFEHNAKFGGYLRGYTFDLVVASVSKVLSYFYLFIPLLTMGVISREYHSGTLKLLYASPIRIRELVLGKYLGLMIFNVVLLLGIAIFLVTAMVSIQHVDAPIYVSMLLGFFLLSNAYMAIGLFISCLTSYQIVAGIITYMVFILLSMVGSWGQGSDVVRDLTYFLSISGRIDYMIAGLITSRNLLYFLLIIILFIGLTIIKLKSTQESKKWTVSFARYCTFIVIVLTIGYISSRPGKVWYWDVTKNNQNTIAPATQNVLNEMDGSPLTVTLYTNLLDGFVLSGLPASRNAYIWDFWEKYLRFYSNIQFKYEYYYKLDDDNTMLRKEFPNRTEAGIAALRAKTFDVDFKRFKHHSDLSIDLSNESSRLLMELEYKGKKTILRTFKKVPAVWPTQSNVSAAIRRLVRDTVPKVVFTTGHFERSPWKYGEREYAGHTAYKGLHSALINYGVDVDTLTLAEQIISPETSVLVVADPKTKLAPIEQNRILEFIDSGGNALFYAEPGKQSMLNPILNYIGVNINNGTLLNMNSEYSPIDVRSSLNRVGNSLAREEEMQLYQFDSSRFSGRALFESAAEITYTEMSGFKIEPIVSFKGSENVWLENGYVGLDSAGSTFSLLEGDIQKGAYVMGVKLSRQLNGKEQRIVVFSDADFMALKNSSGYTIGVGVYSWLLYNEYPVYIDYFIKKDVFLTIGRSTANLIWKIYVYGIPGLLLLSGLIILIRRSRK